MQILKTNTTSIVKKMASLVLITPIVLINASCENKPPNTYKTENPLESISNKEIKKENISTNKNSNKSDNVELNEKDIIVKEINKRKNNLNPNPSKYELIDLYNIRVIDGDTVHGVGANKNKIKVRMLGIDAPESSQPMGDISTKSLEECVFHNPEVKLLVDKSNKTDRYGRYLAKVNSGVIDCNLYQVENGMAYFYRDYADGLPDGEQPVFDKAEKFAQESSVGVWSQDLVRPWEYRKAKRSQ